jgi:putative membrane protein
VTYTAHMVLHVILAQLVPLLLVGGFHPRRHPHALLAWIAGSLTMIGTSLPVAYQLAQASGTLEWTMRITLVIAGWVFWRPVFGGEEHTRLTPGMALLYVVTACFSTTLAGVYIAFSAVSTDQQVAGLIMWVPCCMIYLGAGLGIVIRAMQGERAPRPASQ